MSGTTERQKLAANVYHQTGKLMVRTEILPRGPASPVFLSGPVLEVFDTSFMTILTSNSTFTFISLEYFFFNVEKIIQISRAMASKNFLALQNTAAPRYCIDFIPFKHERCNAQPTWPLL